MTDQENTILPTLNLKPKHRRFVDAYFRLALNATDAYADAYPKASRETARRNGSMLLTNTDIRAEIDRRFSEQVMDSSEVLKRLSDMARANLLPFIRITSEGFTYFDFSHPEAKNYFHLIKKIKTKRTRRIEGRGKDAEEWEDEWVEVELHDAQAALEKIGRHLDLFPNKLDVTSAGEAITFIVERRKDEEAGGAPSQTA
jgi:phage terminase small subunit